MLQVSIKAKDYADFTEQVKKGSPTVQHIFRDGVGFMGAHGYKEVRICYTPESFQAYNSFFHGQAQGFEGDVLAPDYEDFGVARPTPLPPDMPVEEAPKEEEAPSEDSPPKTV